MRAADSIPSSSSRQIATLGSPARRSPSSSRCSSCLHRSSKDSSEVRTRSQRPRCVLVRACTYLCAARPRAPTHMHAHPCAALCHFRMARRRRPIHAHYTHSCRADALASSGAAAAPALVQVQQSLQPKRVSTAAGVSGRSGGHARGLEGSGRVQVRPVSTDEVAHLVLGGEGDLTNPATYNPFAVRAVRTRPTRAAGSPSSGLRSHSRP